MKVFAVALFTGLVALAAGYGGGAPEGACGDMVPQHHTPPQTSASPFAIDINRNTVKPKGKVYVTLSAKEGDSFKGFFIQARVGDTAVGKFDPADGVKLVNCGNGVATGATHENSQAKTKVTVAWEAPPELSENVIFTVTTARDGGTFWVAQKAAPLKVQA
ncbi:putative defense protein Hdd11-like isoform X2 [Neocloeon triangulifer]|nr:putative defense protein Hdd11-like isoform X2 [Neocloeon triangulifer]XP_059477377.1 putative defense protein Hdd11-like isoform X2 [Neocloeon triangulifer]